MRLEVGKKCNESEEGEETDLGALLWGRGRGKTPRGLGSKAASAWVSGKIQCNLFPCAGQIKTSPLFASHSPCQESPLDHHHFNSIQSFVFTIIRAEVASESKADS